MQMQITQDNDLLVEINTRHIKDINCCYGWKYC